jgi:hypothetical protein
MRLLIYIEYVTLDEVQFGDAVGTGQIYIVTVQYKRNQNDYMYIN